MRNSTDLAQLVIDIVPSDMACADSAGGVMVSLAAVGDCPAQILVDTADRLCAPVVRQFADAMLHNHTRCTASGSLPLMKTDFISSTERLRNFRKMREERVNQCC